MNDKNNLTNMEEEWALQGLEASEMQAIVGGQAGGHGHSEEVIFHPVPVYATRWLPPPG
jgi:hypothetical protein